MSIGVHPTGGIVLDSDTRSTVPSGLAVKYHRMKTLKDTLTEIKDANPDGDNPGLLKAEEIVSRMADVAEADYHADAIRYVDSIFAGPPTWSFLFSDLRR